MTNRKITWLLGRTGGVGVVPSGKYLLLLIGDAEGQISPENSFLLSQKAVRGLVDMLKGFEPEYPPDSNPSPALWGDGPFPEF
jgi:hypothetical protein